MSISWWKVVAVLAIIGGLIYGWNRFQAEREARIVAELQLTDQKALNDSTAAKLTVAHASNAQLGAALDAAKELNGKLIAAVKINVPKRDTVIQHDTLYTIVDSDSTRTATFKDSTFAGTITGTVVAPPCCDPLGVSYRIDRPAFAPTVAFIEVGGKTVASVTWNGEAVQIEAPYAKPQPKKLRWFGGWAEANYRFIADSTYDNLDVRGGLLLRLGQTTRIQTGVSIDKTAFAGLRMEF